MAHDDRPLFSQGHLSASLRAREEAVEKEVDAFDGNRLLNTPLDDLCTYFVEKLQIEPLSLADDSQITMETREATLETSRLPHGRWEYGDHQPTIPATAFSFYVPFTGEAELFKFQPGTFTLNAPRGTVRDNDLVLTFTVPADQEAGVEVQLTNQLAQIRNHIRSITSEVEDLNKNRLPRAIRRSVEERRARLLKTHGVVASLGYRLRRREGMPTTYAAPSVRRKIAPPPVASSAPFKPEPALADDDYEHILTVMQNMALVLERSPSAFTALGEEHLRWHFVVQLNGHYEGSATGETFNVEGKTDILVRDGGKNVFIAECKFWSGPKGFHETIDQLLGYASWRDTKTAIVVFNRDTQFSTVLAKLPDGLRSHPNFKREEKPNGETRFRAVLSHKSDPSRELTVTVLAFDVPK